VELETEYSSRAYLFYKHAGGGGDDYPDEYGEVLTPEALVREGRHMVKRYVQGNQIKRRCTGPAG
jgi:hypothetical protein